MSFNKGKDYYTILGVNKKATQEQIEKAYKILFNEMTIGAKSDKKDEVTKKFEDVREAHMTLGNADRRAAYDKKSGPQMNLDQAYKIFESFFHSVGIEG